VWYIFLMVEQLHILELFRENREDILIPLISSILMVAAKEETSPSEIAERLLQAPNCMVLAVASAAGVGENGLQNLFMLAVRYRQGEERSPEQAASHLKELFVFAGKEALISPIPVNTMSQLHEVLMTAWCEGKTTFIGHEALVSNEKHIAHAQAIDEVAGRFVGRTGLNQDLLFSDVEKAWVELPNQANAVVVYMCDLKSLD
jgi:hypothetical protein